MNGITNSSIDHSGFPRRARSGQALLIAILTLGGAMLGATTLAGLLMLYQIRATTDSVNSAKAVFAADSGINWVLFDYFNASVAEPTSSFANGASDFIVCSDSKGAAIDCGNASATSAFSRGTSLNSQRAFVVNNLMNATGTVP